MRPTHIALLAGLVVVALGTVVPMLLGPVEYEPALAVNLVTAIAVIATAAYAAENLTEFKEQRAAEFSPFLDVRVRSVRDGRRLNLEVSIRNIGRGAAAGLEIAAWWRDPDDLIWLPHRVRTTTDLLLAEDEVSGSLEFPQIRPLVQKHFGNKAPRAIVQLRYRDALRPDREQFVPFDVSGPLSHEQVLPRSPLKVPKELASTEGKQRKLDEELQRIATAADLASQGLTLQGTVRVEGVSVALLRGEDQLWRSNTSADQALYHVTDSVERSLERFLKGADEEDAEGGELV